MPSGKKVNIVLIAQLYFITYTPCWAAHICCHSKIVKLTIPIKSSSLPTMYTIFLSLWQRARAQP